MNWDQTYKNPVKLLWSRVPLGNLREVLTCSDRMKHLNDMWNLDNHLSLLNIKFFSSIFFYNSTSMKNERKCQFIPCCCSISMTCLPADLEWTFLPVSTPVNQLQEVIKVLSSNYKTGQNHVIGWCVGTTDPKSKLSNSKPWNLGRMTQKEYPA